MPNPLRLDHALDAQSSTLSVVVAQARRKPSRSFAEASKAASDLGSWLPADAGFFLELGVVPSTEADDGAPLDILVLGDGPPADTIERVRLIGVLEADHTEKGAHAPA